MSPKMILVNEWYSGHLVCVWYLLSLKIMLAFGPCFSNNKILTPSIQLSQCNLLGFKQPPSWHRFKTFSTFLTSPHVFVYSSSQRLKQNNDSNEIIFVLYKVSNLKRQVSIVSNNLKLLFSKLQIWTW